jgi:hypothetical protein
MLRGRQPLPHCCARREFANGRNRRCVSKPQFFFRKVATPLISLDSRFSLGSANQRNQWLILQDSLAALAAVVSGSPAHLACGERAAADNRPNGTGGPSLPVARALIFPPSGGRGDDV